jgi:hypothetical protein
MPTLSKALATAACTLALLCLSVTGGRAETLPKPTGRVMLVVSGDIANTNGDGTASFDFPMLEAIGGTTTETTTAWTEGKSTFEGVQISKLVERVGAKGKTAVAIALNDYKVEIPVADFAKYPVILAYRMDGERLKIRDKGPLWIIYPQDDFPELKTKQTQAKWVWQVKEIRFK